MVWPPKKGRGKKVPKACFVIFCLFFCLLHCRLNRGEADLPSGSTARHTWGSTSTTLPDNSLPLARAWRAVQQEVFRCCPWSSQDLNLQTGPSQLLPVCVPSAPSASLQQLQQTKHTLSFFVCLFYFLTFYVSPVWKLTCFEFVPLSSALLGSTKT